MSLLAICIPILVLAVLLWAVKTYIPMELTLYKLLFAVVVIGVILWLLQSFGILGTLSQVRVR